MIYLLFAKQELDWLTIYAIYHYLILFEVNLETFRVSVSKNLGKY